MDLFPILLVAIGLLGLVTVISIEPARRTFLEGAAISVIVGFSVVVAVVIYIGMQAMS